MRPPAYTLHAAVSAQENLARLSRCNQPQVLIAWPIAFLWVIFWCNGAPPCFFSMGKLWSGEGSRELELSAALTLFPQIMFRRGQSRSSKNHWYTKHFCRGAESLKSLFPSHMIDSLVNDLEVERKTDWIQSRDEETSWLNTRVHCAEIQIEKKKNTTL